MIYPYESIINELYKDLANTSIFYPKRKRFLKKMIHKYTILQDKWYLKQIAG